MKTDKLTGKVSQYTHLSDDRIYQERGRVILVAGDATPTTALKRPPLPTISKALQRRLLAHAVTRLKEAGLFQTVQAWDVELAREMLDPSSKVQECGYFVTFINPEGTRITLKQIELDDQLRPFLDYKWEIDE